MAAVTQPGGWTYGIQLPIQTLTRTLVRAAQSGLPPARRHHSLVALGVRRSPARLQVLLVLEPGLAEVHLGVHQAGEHQATGGVHKL